MTKDELFNKIKRQVEKQYKFFPKFYSYTTFEEMDNYTKETFAMLVKRNWKKRIAKKILKLPKLIRNNQIMNEYWSCRKCMVGVSAADFIKDSMKTESFARRILTPELEAKV
jgi:hypothetical protein